MGELVAVLQDLHLHALSRTKAPHDRKRYFALAKILYYSETIWCSTKGTLQATLKVTKKLMQHICWMPVGDKMGRKNCTHEKCNACKVQLVTISPMKARSWGSTSSLQKVVSYVQMCVCTLLWALRPCCALSCELRLDDHLEQRMGL